MATANILTHWSGLNYNLLNHIEFDMWNYYGLVLLFQISHGNRDIEDRQLLPTFSQQGEKLNKKGTNN